MQAHPLQRLLVVKISSAGQTLLVYHPEQQAQDAATLTAALGAPAAEQRGAYVWPLARGKRRAFRTLRRICGNAGPVAAWTRAWRGPWVVVLPGACVRLPGRYPTHAAAVQAEVAWILEHKG